MGLKDIITKARARTTGTLVRHRTTIDRGIIKVGEAANSRTGGRYQDRIRRGSDRARAGLDKINPDRPDSDGQAHAEPVPKDPR